MKDAPDQCQPPAGLRPRPAPATSRLAYSLLLFSTIPKYVLVVLYLLQLHTCRGRPV